VAALVLETGRPVTTQIKHTGGDVEQRWIVRVDDADLTSWPRWRVRQLRRGLDLVRKAIAGERELTPLERAGRSMNLLTKQGQEDARRRRLHAFGEQLRTDLEYGR
jgi:hypothetical protein